MESVPYCAGRENFQQTTGVTRLGTQRSAADGGKKMLVKKFISIEQTDNGYRIHADHADVLLVFMTKDIIRIRLSFRREFPEASYALVTTAWPDDLDNLLREERRRIQALRVPYTETGTELAFDTGHVRLVMCKEPLSFSLWNGGECLYRDLMPRAFEQDHLGRLYHYSCLDRADDHFYGFGEKTGPLDKQGKRLRMSPKDAIGHDPEFGEPLYKHIPFYLRVNGKQRRALGFFYNSSYDCTFDLGNEISGYWDPYVYYRTEGPDIDLFLLNGPTPADVVRRYTFLTGTSAMPPKRALGYTASTMYYAELEKDCDREILRVMDHYEKAGLAIDNFWLASGYSADEKRRRYVFHWNLKRFPDPDAFIRRMNERGIDVIPNLKPGILDGHPFQEELEQADAFIRTPDGSADYIGRWWGGAGRFVDFTNSSAREAWKDLLERQMLQKGVRTVWNDNCEYDGVEDRNAQCSFEGMRGTMAQLKIIHSNLMAYTGRQALAEVYPDERPYIINRAGFAGIQRYAQVWGGDNLTDWRTLKFNITMILGMGLSGVANTGCDIGGFAGEVPEKELFLRWVQNGIFQPRFCINSANNDNTVTQPWMYEDILNEIREAYRIRYRLMPYLYSLMREAYETGLPVWRPLFLEFPQDERTYTDDSFTFLLGKSLLIANVVEKGADVRKLYLPAGCGWYDIHDSMKRYEGGQVIEIPVGPISIPMFLRGDGIVVTRPDAMRADSPLHKLFITASAEQDCTFVFYDDDGHTRDFERGVFTRLEMKLTAGVHTVLRFSADGVYRSEPFDAEIRMTSPDKGACWVSAGGRMLSQFLVREDWEAVPEGWFYSLTDRCIRIRCSIPVKDTFEIVVSHEKFDLIGMETT